MHIAGPSVNGGGRVIEIFESPEAASQFLDERFAPALAALGYTGDPPQPEFWSSSCLTADRLVTGV